MKDAVLLELAARWEREAKTPDCEDGSDEAKVSRAAGHAHRQALRACADTLRNLVQMLGEDAPVTLFVTAKDRVIEARANAATERFREVTGG